MEKTWTIGLTLFLTLCLDIPGVGGRKEGTHGENAQKRSSRSSETKGGRCSYTFIVPQQKLTGALCLNTQSSYTNQSEVAALRAELKQQQEQMEKLQGKLEQEGSLAMEVRALQKESSSMNSRIAQLYAQLLHEVIHKKDHVLEQQRVETLLLNATTQALQVSSNYRELEKKYGVLTSMMSSQNQIIARLEKQCQSWDTTQAPLVTSEPPKSQPNVDRNYSSEAKEITNDVQRDQSALPPQQEKTVVSLNTTTANIPTDPSFISSPVTKTPGPWRDCQHVLESGETTSGIYLLRPQSANRLLQAWCEQSRDEGGWTVIQRRQDGSVNFFRTWEQYKQGFGNLDGEYWLGLEHLYWLTKQAKYKLRVAMEDWQGRQVYAEYDSFHLEPESDWYRLRLGQYQGNAGDSLSWHNNKAFTTLDRDKDSYTGNCAHYQKGGWWYHKCAHSNLNGVWYRGGHYRSRYQDGVYWAEFHGGSYSLKRVSIMIKPK
ncbi:angiopoietin-related protein 6 isoform X1 [Pseudochaenichthys georgianus]|uniref:angiopoietin-related protein 6 isoform X1 n=2 Tax=Pseudochaenichthys georgianus TaxID=52239 RepID=UPI00146A29C0|nr:angiopoietin-related protein 6 isoform X1 [Pseudochaenichthys georgianus]XP_033944261.1 angiopoietin-related protein 6 isoform X1 [Pseudochaenichthys georgianus]XP_033944262.1 angiopoietin-related protein 6 isoform X1 [Pseudochaenichthys georgianus]XP_033944263.1 angiopoietin-related protein 6 isoform X1 [Pseudochaenichthys georgianus]XP_033944265.1 angiopoietin-related protein 6 isoform X1 [Pseudochaenichthys georgianus]XP_033944266.1 angiopoietin-related protein 6 isoform X1 [Pseudochaeni